MTMTIRAMDHRDRSTHIIPTAAVVASGVLAAVVAFAIVGGAGSGGNDGAGAPLPTASPSSPATTPTPTPAVTPVATPPPTQVEIPADGGSDAMPLKVDLANATGADVYVDIADRTGLLESAESGTPGDGQSVEAYTLVAENVDATTLRLTWVDFPIDNALALYIDETADGLRLVMVQPAPTGAADAMGFDRELILSFSQPISADSVETFLQEGLDTPG
jgi:hypothetical protein